MPLGILEDRKLEHVPGTAPLQELGQIFEGDTSALKHDATGLIVLVPQPSDSPNDPYNWPRWRKELFTVAMAWSCACTGALAPLVGASFVPLSVEYGVSLQTFVGGVQGGLLMSNAFGSIVFNSLAVKYGKRPFYLLTSLLLVASSFWAGASKSFASLVAARVVQGACQGPAEALIPSSIADVWFVHERGFRSAIYTISTIAGISLGQPIGGAIIQNGSYRIAFYGIGGAFVVQLLMTFFWMPETAFHREEVINIDTSGDKQFEERIEFKREPEQTEVLELPQANTMNTTSSTTVPKSQQSKTWLQDLHVYSGYRDQISLWRHILQPFRMLGSLSVLWGAIIFTSAMSWLVVLSVVLSQIFSAPPYFFSVGAVGTTNVAAFIGSILGTLISGPLIDRLARYLSKKNRGIFEPEFRIPLCLGYLIFTGTGAFVWGHTLSKGMSWPIPVILGLGMMSFGIQLAMTSCIAYVVDCHRQNSAEAVALMNFSKAGISFVFTETVNDWVGRSGIREVFFTLGGITIAISLTGIPMYIFGKKSRSWAYRHHVGGKNSYKP